jgi:hypothetical protein
MVRPIIRGKSYVGKTFKSMKATDMKATELAVARKDNWPEQRHRALRNFERPISSVDQLTGCKPCLEGCLVFEAQVLGVASRGVEA